MSDWINFYDFKHSVIYVNARHRDVHYRTIAEDIRAYVPSPAAHVLDYGCGEATSADLVAGGQRATGAGRGRAERARLAHRALCRPPEDRRDRRRAGGRAAEGLVRSHRDAFGRAISDAGRARPAARDVPRAAQAGRTFILGDIVPPHLAAPAAALSLLRFGAANGFFWAAAFGLVRIFASDYLRLKRTAGLSHYTEAAMLDTSARPGFKAERAARNIGHNQRRMTFPAARPDHASKLRLTETRTSGSPVHFTSRPAGLLLRPARWRSGDAEAMQGLPSLVRFQAGPPPSKIGVDVFLLFCIFIQPGLNLHECFTYFRESCLAAVIGRSTKHLFSTIPPVSARTDDDQRDQRYACDRDGQQHGRGATHAAASVWTRMAAAHGMHERAYSSRQHHLLVDPGHHWCPHQ